MSSIFACLTRIFGRHNKDTRRPRSETLKPQSNTHITPVTKNTSVVEAVPQSVGNTTQENAPVTTEELPIFARHISEEPDTHSDIETEAGENVDLLEGENAPVAEVPEEVGC